MKTILFNLPVRVHADSHDNITRFEHMDLSTLTGLSEDEVRVAIARFEFPELDERFSSFVEKFLLVQLNVVFDDDERSFLTNLKDIESLYGKTPEEANKLFT